MGGCLPPSSKEIVRKLCKKVLGDDPKLKQDYSYLESFKGHLLPIELSLDYD